MIGQTDVFHGQSTVSSNEVFQVFMIRDLLKASAVYIFASVVAGLVNFLLLPVLTRLLTPTDYGIIGILTATIGILGAIVGMNPHLLITVRYPQLEKRELKALISAVVPITLLTGLVAFLALEALRLLWSDFHLPHWVLFGLAIAAILGVGQTVGLTILQMQKRPVAYTSIAIGGVLLGAILTLTLVVGFRLDWRGKFIGDITGMIIFGTVLIVYLFRKGYVGFSFTRGSLKEVVHYSAPLVIHALAFWALNAQDRYFLAGMVGLEATGLYSVAYAFGNILNLVHASVLKGYNPYFFEYAVKEEKKAKIVLITYGYCLLSIAGLVLFIIGVKVLVPVFLGDRFTSSYIFIPWIALGYTFNALRNIMTGYLYIAEKTRLIGGLTLVAAFLNALLNYVLIKLYGSIGAAVATAATFAFIAVLTTIFAVRSHPMPWATAIRSLLGGRRG